MYAIYVHYTEYKNPVLIFRSGVWKISFSDLFYHRLHKIQDYINFKIYQLKIPSCCPLIVVCKEIVMTITEWKKIYIATFKSVLIFHR